MKLFLAFHHRLHRWQQKLWAKLFLSTLLCGIIAILIGFTLIASYRLYDLRGTVYGLLTGPDQNIVASQLEETGYITISGESFGDPRLKKYPILNQDGLVVDPVEVTSLILSTEVPNWAPIWLLQDPTITWIFGGLAVIWCLIAIWLDLFLPLLYASTIALGGWYFCQWMNAPNGAVAIVGMCILGFSYHLLITLFKLLFRTPRPITSLARGVLLEATRTKLSLAFLSILLLVLPLIPVMLDPESPLRYRVQTLLSRSLGTTFTIAAFLTVFLGCATVAFEIRDRQIWQVVTKPVSKLNYLLGKWVGVISLNFVILTIAGLSTFMYMQYLRTAPVAEGFQGELDRLAVGQEVLTARVESTPTYETLTNEQIAARVEVIIEADPDLRDKDDIQVQLRQKLRQDVQDTFLAQQRQIPPNRDDLVYSQTYHFEGLKHARDLGTRVSFKYRFHIRQSDEHETYKAAFVYNDDRASYQMVTYTPTMTHVTLIEPMYINEDGSLSITIFNLYKPPPDYLGRGTLGFDEGGIRVLYKVADFEGNFFRAMLVLWVKLAFLAALALASATFLSFPVACMITLTIFTTGTLAPYLSEALQAYVPPSTAIVDFGNIGQVVQWGFENTIRAIATAMVFMLDGFGAQRPTDQLVGGMLVSWSSVLRGALTIGVMWSGIALAIGTIVLKKRQLAIYSGSG